MGKRARSEERGAPVDGHKAKKAHVDAKQLYNKVATAENAAAVDENPPLWALLDAVKGRKSDPRKGESVVYWMRMEDLRVADNRALSRASEQAQKDGIPLLVLFVISPQDYEAHDRGPRRIGFMLRNLKMLKASLDELHIPLHIVTIEPRRSIPAKVVNMLKDWGATRLFANISYEVDELRRDIKTCEIGKEAGVKCDFVQDKLIVNPGVLTTKEGKAYAVYSPWQKRWVEVLNDNLNWIEEAPMPKPNSETIRSLGRFSKLFKSEVPEFVKRFECADKDKMAKYWPAGTDAAMQMLDRFLHTKARSSQIGEVSPLSDGAEASDKNSRIKEYSSARNLADMDTTSRLSPYLASGVISARACIRATLDLLKRKSVEAGRNNGTGMWVQEIAWRDFYNHVMVSFPRVSMGRPYLEKFANVKWETNEEHLQAWKDGKTGVPIVDAAMRQLNEFGWMHNRSRMIVAMYLTKDLMLDWRLGEKYFMENLIDGDLASNNGGWQWSASTGTDPQPYFRIFNPVSQSEKADPSGNYTRHYVPELSKLTGKAIHEPSAESASKHGYPLPIVNHKLARDRALRRYKNPGEE
ncbi:PHR1_2 [Sanghuangporus sanghuang]